MTSPLRPCGRAECRLCHPDAPTDEPLAMTALGVAALVVIAIFAFVLLPVLAS